MDRAISGVFMKCSRQTRESGIQLAEAAIVLPILLMFMAAIAEFGNYFFYYTTLSKATRTGVRYATSKAFTTTEMNRARNLVICGDINTCENTSPVLPGLSNDNIQITGAGGTASVPDTVTVKIVGYNYNSVFNLSKVAKSGTSWTAVPVSPSSTMRYLVEN
jgi:Flp pilus assembly protein TadG